MTHRLLLDVSSMGYRAFFALKDGPFTPDGRHIGLVHGYLDMVTRLIVTRHPDEVVHVYDHDWRPMARTDIYPPYKGNRQPDPDGLPEQFVILREVLDAAGMVQAQTENWEAEDAIGAFCLDATPEDRIEIVSGDRDLIQLVRDPVVTLLFTLRGVTDLAVFDEAGVLDKYGVPASRYVDFAILRGDPSDGLPGVKGIGEKTARDLIQRFDTLDAVIAAAEGGDMSIKPATRANIVAAKDYLADMQRLVPINADAPMSFWAEERDDEALTRLGSELGIKGPIQRLLAAMEAPGTTPRDAR